MSWRREDDGFGSNPKVARILARYGVDGLVALGWRAVVLGSSRDGLVDTELALAMVPATDPELVLAMLADVGLVDAVEGQRWAWHDWLDYQPDGTRDWTGRTRDSGKYQPRKGGQARAAGAQRDARGRLLPSSTPQRSTSAPPSSTLQRSPSAPPRPALSSAPSSAGPSAGARTDQRSPAQVQLQSRPVPVPTPDGVRDGSTPRASSAAPWVEDDPYGLDAQLLTREAPAAPTPLRGPAPPCAGDPELFRAHQPAHRLAGATWRACEACGWTAPRLADQLRRHGFDPDSLAR